MSRSARWVILMTAGACALAGCSSSGSTKPDPTARITRATSHPSASPTPTAPRLAGPVTFRPVLWDPSQGAMPAASGDSETRAEAALANLDCSHPEKTPSASDTDYLAACSTDGKQTKYLLAPSALSGTHVKSATSQLDTGVFQVNVAFDDTGTKQFADLTAQLAGTQKLIAITVGGAVVSAPYVQSPITDGSLRITGNFDRDQADALAAALTAGAKG